RALEATPRYGPRRRCHRVRRLPHPDGAGLPQADPPPNEAPEPGLRLEPPAAPALQGPQAAARHVLRCSSWAASMATTVETRENTAPCANIPRGFGVSSLFLR